MAQPIWMSYWVGMTPALCNVTSNTLTTASETIVEYTIKSMNLATRAPDTVVESCYYIIQVDQDLWQVDSYIYIYLNAFSTANMYVYAGNNRRNATLIV